MTLKPAHEQREGGQYKDCLCGREQDFQSKWKNKLQGNEFKQINNCNKY